MKGSAMVSLADFSKPVEAAIAKIQGRNLKDTSIDTNQDYGTQRNELQEAIEATRQSMRNGAQTTMGKVLKDLGKLENKKVFDDDHPDQKEAWLKEFEDITEKIEGAKEDWKKIFSVTTVENDFQILEDMKKSRSKYEELKEKKE